MEHEHHKTHDWVNFTYLDPYLQKEMNFVSVFDSVFGDEDLLMPSIIF